MIKEYSLSGYGARFQRKRALCLGALVISAVVLISLISTGVIVVKNSSRDKRQGLMALFEASSFDKAFEESGVQLKEKPLDFFLLTIRGFSAFQLAIAQINNFDTLKYVDECIWSLRKALLSRNASSGPAAGNGHLYYVLGKAYYYKGEAYADLSVKYLEKARESGYTAPDIPQYLGLTYASLGDYRNSISAFSLALDPEEEHPSDILLLSIARSYLALEDYEAAKAYLIRCAETSRDSKTVNASRLLLGDILAKNGDYSGAEQQLLKALEEGGESAETHFQLGELYSAGGDSTSARAEFRRAVKLDPAHLPARARLGI
jgi:tetratricopeptide (TPR) repeat protein